MPDKTPKPKHPTTLIDVFKQMQPSESVNPVLGAQIEQFWDAQEKMLEEAENFAQQAVVPGDHNTLPTTPHKYACSTSLLAAS